MKKSFALLFLLMMLMEASGQNADQKLSIGLFGGKTEYKGDLDVTDKKFDKFISHSVGIFFIIGAL